jgi:hypothetical protein
MTEHSRWGVVALGLLASGESVERIFTMSSPFGGSKAATMLNMAFCLTPVFADINPLGSTIRSVRQDEITTPIRSVVATSGGTLTAARSSNSSRPGRASSTLVMGALRPRATSPNSASAACCSDHAVGFPEGLPSETSGVTLFAMASVQLHQ